MNKSKSRTYRGKKLRPRGDSWQVDLGEADGKRTMRSKPTLAEAKALIDAFWEEQRVLAIDEKNKRIGLYALTDAQRVDVMAALEELKGAASLLDAARFYRKHMVPEDSRRTLAEVVDEFVEAKRLANRRAHTVMDYRQKFGKLAKDMGGVAVHEITTKDLERWLNQHGYRQSSRAGYRRRFIGLFGFAVAHGYAKANPAEALEKVTVDEKMPEVFTVPEVKALMARAQEVQPLMVPYFAIGLFAGLRPSEIERLNWRDIDLERRRIVVRPEVAKKRRQRYVDVSECLLAWLAPHRRQSGPVFFSRHWFDAVRGMNRNKDKRGDPIRWADDIMRHSFGSYYLARNEDAAKTALQMGHTTQDILFQHYRELVTREDAEEYWSISPKHDGNVIALSASAQ